jgi:hypothetical protein
LRGINTGACFMSPLQGAFMPPLQGALPTSALVMAVAFPHHAAQENTAPEAQAGSAGRDECQMKNEERCGGE